MCRDPVGVEWECDVDVSGMREEQQDGSLCINSVAMVMD